MKNPVPIVWGTRGINIARAKFEVGGLSYTVWIEGDQVQRKGQDYGTAVWDILFFQGDDEMHMHTTGTGGQFQVYATVMDILIQHMKKFGERSIAMIAEDPSRRSLYPKLLKRFFPTYEIEVSDRDDIYAWMPNQYPEGQQ